MRPSLLTYTAAGAGRQVQVGAFGTTFKVVSAVTRGSVAMVEHTLEPGRLGAPLHRHSREDEISYVLEGTLSVQQGGKIERGGPGTCIHKPRGVFHTFWNAGPEPVRFLEIIAPGGFELYFEELSLLMAEPGVPDVTQLAALGMRYGVEFDFATLPDLLRRHRLELG